MKKIKGLVGLIRFELPFSAGICVVIGQLLALGEFALVAITFFGFISVFCISAAILVLNDYFDVETDKINTPARPIPSGIVSTSEALLFSMVLLAAGILSAYLISFDVFLFSVVLSVIGFLYNRYFKKSGQPGNLMVSISVGATFIYGGLTVGLPFEKSVIIFALIAALIDLGEEIAADAMDKEGDKLINSNSIAIRHGESIAIKISVGIFITVILISIIPFLLNWFVPIYLIPILIMDSAIGYSAVKLLKAANPEGRKLVRSIYLGATFGLVVFIIMKLFDL